MQRSVNQKQLPRVDQREETRTEEEEDRGQTAAATEPQRHVGGGELGAA